MTYFEEIVAKMQAVGIITFSHNLNFNVFYYITHLWKSYPLDTSKSSFDDYKIIFHWFPKLIQCEDFRHCLLDTALGDSNANARGYVQKSLIEAINVLSHPLSSDESLNLAKHYIKEIGAFCSTLSSEHNHFLNILWLGGAEVQFYPIASQHLLMGLDSSSVQIEKFNRAFDMQDFNSLNLDKKIIIFNKYDFEDNLRYKIGYVSENGVYQTQPLPSNLEDAFKQKNITEGVIEDHFILQALKTHLSSKVMKSEGPHRHGVADSLKLIINSHNRESSFEYLLQHLPIIKHCSQDNFLISEFYYKMLVILFDLNNLGLHDLSQRQGFFLWLTSNYSVKLDDKFLASKIFTTFATQMSPAKPSKHIILDPEFQKNKRTFCFQGLNYFVFKGASISTAFITKVIENRDIELLHWCFFRKYSMSLLIQTPLKIITQCLYIPMNYLWQV